MKKIVYPLCLFVLPLLTQAQNANVGIGTLNPLARLHVADSNVLFSYGTTPDANTLLYPPVEGAGTRWMWYSAKAAMRAGYVTGNHWNRDSIGLASFAVGYNSKAIGFGAVSMGAENRVKGTYAFSAGSFSNVTGDYAISLGVMNNATGVSSIAIGSAANASADYAISIGRNTTASGTNAVSTGYQTTASGSYATALGSQTSATGSYATSMGNGSIASGSIATAMGALTKAKGTMSTAAGYETVAKSYGSFVVGAFNDTSSMSNEIAVVATDALFVVGNGTSAVSRKNAMVALRNGNVGIGVSQPTARLQVNDSAVLFRGPTTVPLSTAYLPPVSGQGVRLMWYPQKAALRAGYVASNRWDADSIGRASVALGYNSIAKGQYSLALGYNAQARGVESMAFGSDAVSNAQSSVAIGSYSYAAGDHSFAIGDRATAGDYGSYALGVLSSANPIHAVAVGYSASATGQYAIALGIEANSQSLYGKSFGTGTIVTGYGATSLGMFNDTLVNSNRTARVSTGPLLIVGNGTSSINRSNALMILNNGNTGIGTNAPIEKLHVAGDILATGTITPSDERYKENIQLIDNPLEKVMQLRGVTYHYKVADFPEMGLSGNEQAGVIAQDVEAVLPQVVKTNSTGYKAVDYAKIIPLLIESIKAQQIQIATQQKEIDALRKLLNQ